MYNTELGIVRKQVRDALVNAALGPSRGDNVYWDEDELLRLVDVGSQYSAHRISARVFMYAGMIAAGVDPAKVEAITGYSAAESRAVRVTQFLINPDQKARILAEVEATVPETVEAGRFQPARQRFSGVDVVTTGGKPVHRDVGKLSQFTPS
jgi:hypothetical protein